MSQAIFHFQVSLFPRCVMQFLSHSLKTQRLKKNLNSVYAGIWEESSPAPHIMLWETRRWLLHLCDCTENKLLSSDFSALTFYFVITKTRQSKLILDIESPSHALPNHTLLHSYCNCFLVSWWHYSLPGRRSLWGERIITLDGPVIWEVGQTLRKCTIASFSMTSRGMAVW